MTELLDEEEPPIYPPPPSLRNYQTTAQFGKPSFNDISYGPKPPSQFQPLSSSPKRKLDCIQLEEDDLSQFKRIRLVSKEKRKKLVLSCRTLLAGPHSTQLNNKSEMNKQLGMGFTHCKLLWAIHIRTPSHTCTLSLGSYETGASTKQRK